MAGFDIDSMKTLPGLLKPILFVILLIYLILMAASYYGPGWWIWFTLILQFVFVILINLLTLFGLETVLTTRRKWSIFEIIYSGIFAVLSIANTIVQITLLIRHHSSLFGVAALICFGLVLLYGLNCMMMFKIWRQDGISSQAPGPGVRPGNTGNMHPGLGSAPAAFPGAVPPTSNISYPPAIPPGATFPSNTT
uniref:MARVEL domain-containing protein n=1 Tax=Ascaris lumbricoides TaxID=6252 RepID=A0A0M3HQ97_ASCLU